MADNYWDNYWRERRSRRRFLGGAMVAGAGASALALVGCGDDDDDDGGTQLATPTSSGANPTATPADPFANAKRGGVYKADQTGDPPSIDPYGNLSFLTKGFSAFVYSRLFKYNAGPGVKKADLKPVGDLAETAEASPDGLAFTIKLRQAKFHNVAPVNGRAITTDDIKYSWGRMTDPKNTNAAQVSFVDRVEYPDASTVKFVLKTPNAAFYDVLSDANLFWIMPKEADGGFDPATKAIGSGPWMLDSYTPSTKFVFKKNPEWHVKGFPLMDGVESAIIPEYANRLAQFQAGNTDVTGLTAEDLVNVKKALANVQLYGEVSQLLSFMYFDPDPNSPWNKDPRIKQAISMSIDRAAQLELGYNIKKLKDAGLDVSERWNNLIPAGLERYWLDPTSSAQGETAKFFKYNPNDAKALLAAAGAADLSATYQYTANRYGNTFNAIAESNISFMNAIGIKTTTDVQDYSSKYITQTFVGNFKGIAFGYETPFPEAGNYPIRMFTDNPNNHSKITNDEALKDLAAKQQRELDPAKRKELFFEIQRKNAEKMHYIPLNAGAGTGWTGFREWVKGVDIQTVPGSYGGATETLPFRWLNKA